jgi:Transglutaminase-like superfamily
VKELVLKDPRLGIATGAHYRTVDEAEIVDMLLVAALVHELQAGQRSRAVAAVTSALETWVDLGLQFQLSQGGGRSFDPVEVVNFMKWAGYNERDRFWSDHFVNTGRAFYREWKPDAAAEPPTSSLEPARFTVKLRRSFNLEGFDRGERLRLRLPLPLSCCADDIEVTPVVDDALSGRLTKSDGRLDFQLAAPGQPTVDLAARISFTTTGRSRDHGEAILPSDQAELYLRPSEGLIRATPRVRALSQAIAGTSRHPLSIVTALWNYLIEELMCGMVHYDQVDVEAPGDRVLESGWYDCQLGSSLLVAMCRAQGIPARVMSGHMLYRLAPGFHYWVEAWIDGQGWTPFDFLTWDLSRGGRDADWRAAFVGRIDYRMVTQRFPLAFTGPMSVRFPQAWHLLNAPSQGGMTIRFAGLNGRLIYSDHVTAELHAKPRDAATADHDLGSA